MTIADNIWLQLGGGRFARMTGAKNFVDCGNALQFDLPRGFATNKANKCRITLDASDTYTVEFFKWNARKLELALLSKQDGIYCDMLRATFTEATGLDCTL